MSFFMAGKTRDEVILPRATLRETRPFGKSDREKWISIFLLLFLYFAKSADLFNNNLDFLILSSVFSCGKQCS